MPKGHKLNCQCGVCCVKRREFDKLPHLKNHEHAVGRGKHAGKLGGLKGGKASNDAEHRARPGYREVRVKGGKNLNKMYPNLMSETQKRLIREEPDRYHDWHVRAGKKGGPASVKKLRQNQKNCYWGGVAFSNKLELTVAKLILITPIEGVNCHIRIGSKTIDFFPQSYDKQFQNCLVEFHPWDIWKRAHSQYYQQRLTAIENSKYKGTPLILITGINGPQLILFDSSIILQPPKKWITLKDFY